jgi:hypothetical protein
MALEDLRSGMHVEIAVDGDAHVLGDPVAVRVRVADEGAGRIEAGRVELLYVASETRTGPGRPTVVARRDLPLGGAGDTLAGEYSVDLALPASAPPSRRGAVKWLARTVLERRGARAVERRRALRVVAA